MSAAPDETEHTLFEHTFADVPSVELASDELQSYWGFDAGDLLPIWASEVAGSDGHNALHSLSLDPWYLLELLIWSFLVPRVKQDLDPMASDRGIQRTVVTRSVDGQYVDLDREPSIPVTPTTVEVPVEAVGEVGRLEPGDIAGALRVAIRHDAFGKEELVRALQSPNSRLRQAAMQVAGELDFEVDRDLSEGRGR